jgi:transposase
MKFELPQRCIIGPAGELVIPPEDQLTPRLVMLIEGECEGLGAALAAQKHGLTRQRYYQLLKAFREQGALALQGQKPGPKTNYVRTAELERQVIRHRFLDPDASVDVIAQKLRQTGFAVSTRSVERVIETYGLQKKPLSLPSQL